MSPGTGHISDETPGISASASSASLHHPEVRPASPSASQRSISQVGEDLTEGLVITHQQAHQLYNDFHFQVRILQTSLLARGHLLQTLLQFIQVIINRYPK